MMKKRKLRVCSRCGQPFKSWHMHQDCKPPEPEPEKAPPDYRLGTVFANGQHVFRRMP